MFKKLSALILGALALMVSVRVGVHAQGTPAATDGARFSAAGALQRPADYREWVYLTSGLGMTYGPTQPTAGEPRFFDNVFVNRESYKVFLQSGRWPEQTQFILEIRQSEQKASINNGGQTQGARILAIESAVKDSARFPGSGWGYFDFGGGDTVKAEVAALPTTERCYACHRDNTAVENTFVQFYPTLMDVARRMGTVKPGYDPNHKVSQ
ncbi:MAG: cytochrome P460 family protein [Vicinamibacterales bacterium]